MRGHPWRALCLLALLGWAGCGDTSLSQARAEATRPVAAAVDGQRVMDTVQALVTAHREGEKLDCSPLPLEEMDLERRPVCELSRDGAREVVRAQLEQAGLTVHEQATEDAHFPTLNLVAELPGATRPEEVVLVGAHFDAFHQGADDNSSGVAAMLEIARVLQGRRLARTVRFVGFDLEEFGLVGSTRFVEAGGAEEVVAALVFDCVGYASREEGSQKGLPGFPMPTVGDFLAVIANETSRALAADLRVLNLHLDVMRVEAVLSGGDGASPLAGNLMRSDHSPFWLRGVPAVFLTDTANFRNPHYHRDTDTVDTLDPRFLSDVTRLSAAAVALWAEELP